jgi:hypothetical protein
MANIGFGLEINKYAKQTGFDQFSTDLSDVLAETAKDAWKYNPVSSSLRLYELNQSRNVDEPLIPFQELNKKYKDSGIFFEQDEKQSTVDILVERKKEERNRQSIIQRGPESNLGNLYLPAVAKFGTAMVASIADPINLAMMFIPVVGQVRFASLVAKYGLTRARMMKGSLEGLVGIAAVEPLVYAAASAEQSDYGLVDSFMAVSFGTILGGGLHVGAGKLKDLNTHRKFKKRIRESRKNLKSKGQEDPAFNLYKEYYPENSRIMKELEEADPDTRQLLLAKAMADMVEEVPVNVKDYADLNPKLRHAQIDENIVEKARKKVNEESIEVNKKLTEVQNKINMLEKYFDPKRKISNIKYTPELKKLKKEKSKLLKREKELVEQFTSREKLIDQRITNKPQEITSPVNAKPRNILEDKIVDGYNKDKAQSSIESRNLDQEILIAENNLVAKLEKQRSLGLPESKETRASVKALEDINSKSKDYENAIMEGINCRIGK